MNTEQERELFHTFLGFAPARMKDGGYADPDVCEDWRIWQARAALQSQDREDAARLDWIESIHGCEVIEFVDGTWEVDIPDGSYGIGKSMREAIDHARRVEGDGE